MHIKSVELTYDVSHECEISDIISDSQIVVKVIPPIPSWVYQMHEDIGRVVLSPRYRGDSFWSSDAANPITVNVFVGKKGEDLRAGPWDLVDICEYWR